jgi:oligopeptide transport system substrate-binding protein
MPLPRPLHLSSALLAGALAAAALLSAGCGGSGGSGGSAGTPPAGTVLRVAQQAEPTSLDPATVEDGPTIEALMHIFEGLVQWDKENKLIPALAESWDVSNGGKTYTFHLRQGVKFHNGRPLTADDFVYSITRSLSSKVASPVAMVYLNDIIGAADYRAGKAATVKGVEAVDDKTLRLTIDAPKAYFLAKLTYPTAYAVCKEEVEKTSGVVTQDSMIGTGAFKMTEYRRGDRIILDANPDYWEGAPKLAREERRILLDNDTRHEKFIAGELDLTDVSASQYRADRDDPKLQPLIHIFPRPSVYYLALNQQQFAPFKDRRVRQAFAQAINKQQIIAKVLQGVPQQAEGILPAGLPGHDASFKGYPYDPAAAKKLLAEAGYPNGQGFPPLKLNCRAQVQDIVNTVTAICADLSKNLGIQAEPEEVEWTTFLKRRNQGVMPCYFLRWAADYLDPQNFLSLMLHTGSPENTLGYSNPEFDRLCDAADVMQDQAKRFATYRQAEKLVVQDAPWIPIYFQKDVELWKPELKGVEDSLLGHLPHKRTYFEGK